MRHTKLTIDLQAIKYNLQTIQKNIKKSTNMMAVVKANGYGHGAVEVAKTALSAGCSHLAVAFPQEGVILRQAGITAPILVLGLIPAQEAQVCVDNNLIVTICSLDHLQPLITAAKNSSTVVQTFLKIDTGMNRIGTDTKNAIKIASLIKQTDNIELTGIFTHFASAGGFDLSYAKLQLANFTNTINQLEELHLKPELVNAAASSAILNLPESHFNLVRAGVAMYGLYPSELCKKKYKLKPALSLTTNISYIKKLPPNSCIGYEMTYKTKDITHIATLPLGYADGYNRLFSNKAQVLIHGKRYNVIGNICMDQLMVELGNNTDIKIGDEVTLVGQQNNDSITLEELAPLANTINYELSCNFSLRVPRIYLN